MNSENILAVVGIILLVSGFAFINFDEKFRTHRIPVSMVYNGLTWLIVGVGGKAGWLGHDFHEKLEEAKLSTLDILVLMLSAMIIVEGLILVRFFDYIGWHIQRRRMKDTAQLVAIATTAFVISIFYDNATATIVMLPLATRFFRGTNLIIALGSIVAGANAGGAGSPFGDFSTIILWLAGRFKTGELILVVGPASVVAHAVSVWDLCRKLVGDSEDNNVGLEEKPDVNWAVVALSFAAVPLVFFYRWIGLDVFFGFVLGGGLTLGAYGYLVVNKRVKEEEGDVAHEALTPLEMEIRALFKNIDKETPFFISQLVLFVEGLSVLGGLAWLGYLFEKAEGYPVLLYGLVALLGPISSMVDNIILVLTADETLTSTDSLLWLFLAYNVAYGGALLIYGSLPGIIVKVIPGMSFKSYRQHITPSIMKGYLAGLAVITFFVVYVKVFS